MKNSPGNVPGLRSDALEAWKRGDLHRARLCLEQVVATSPADSQSWNLLGAVCGMLGLHTDCEQACRKVILLQPGAYTTWGNLGNALRFQGRLDEAREAYQKALAIQPGYHEALNNLGNLEREAGNPDRARHLYQEAIRYKPDYAQAHNNLGNLYKDSGDLDSAGKSYREALRLLPAYPDALVNLGIIYQLNEDFPQAQSCYEQALVLQPDHRDAQFSLGMVLQICGEKDAAERCFRRTLDLDPEHTNARYFLASIDGNGVPVTAPQRYVIELFDTYADRFDEHLVGHLQYHIPERLFTLAHRHIGSGKVLDILDLGCGTGLSGQAFYSICRHLVGVDLSPRMITKARERSIYDELHATELMSVLETGSSRFDLVLSTDVFIYIGDLGEIFLATSRNLRPGGWFCFSVETADSGQDFVLRTSGRYAHADAYIERLASQNGFAILESKATAIRMERGGAIPGRMFVMRTAAGN